ncbi:MAG: NYN domain-containing protein, partial [Anaerolineaceae bacterium]|nr:NYN domain-containing protein [Anaerolineaceae bacterium]
RVSSTKDDPQKSHRQSTYLDALGTLEPLLQIIYGRYQSFPSHCKYCDNDVYCKKCGNLHIKPNEKKTDVNIATYMLVDAFEDLCDAQILVSGDSDYTETLKELRRLFPKKELIIAFPPKREHPELDKDYLRSVCVQIDKSTLMTAQLPRKVQVAPGIYKEKPKKWDL